MGWGGTVNPLGPTKRTCRGSVPGGWRGGVYTTLPRAVGEPIDGRRRSKVTAGVAVRAEVGGPVATGAASSTRRYRSVGAVAKAVGLSGGG